MYFEEISENEQIRSDLKVYHTAFSQEFTENIIQDGNVVKFINSEGQNYTWKVEEYICDV